MSSCASAGKADIPGPKIDTPAAPISTPSFVTLPPRHFVGLSTHFISGRQPDANPQIAIPPLWQQFIKRKSEIPSALKSNLTFGVVVPRDSNLPETAREDTKYIAAVQVEKIQEKLPDGFIGFTTPQGEYAVFENADLISLMSTMKQIYGVWFPASKYEPLNGTLHHLETYKGQGDPANIKVDVAVPVQEKKA